MLAMFWSLSYEEDDGLLLSSKVVMTNSLFTDSIEAFSKHAFDDRKLFSPIKISQHETAEKMLLFWLVVA